MELEKLVKVTMDEIEEMLDSKKVVGEPITVNGSTVIPLIGLGFGFGAGGGSGSGAGPGAGGTPGRGEGTGGGTGGGGGVRPVGVIIIDDAGVRIEGIRGGAASVFERMGETIAHVVEKRAGERATGNGGGSAE